MHHGGGGDGGFSGGHHSEPAGGGHSGHGHPGHGSPGAGGFDPSGRRAPQRDLLDPQGPMGMPKIVSRLASRAGRGRPGSGQGSVGALLFLLSVLAIIIAFGVVFLVHGH